MRLRKVAFAVLFVTAATSLGARGSIDSGTMLTAGVAMSHYCSGDYCGAPYPQVNLSFIDFIGGMSFGGENFKGLATTDPSVSAFTTPTTIPIPPIAIRGAALRGRVLNGTCSGVMKLKPFGAIVSLGCYAHVGNGPYENKQLRIVFVQYDDGLSILDGQTSPPYTGGALVGTYTEVSDPALTP